MIDLEIIVLLLILSPFAAFYIYTFFYYRSENFLSIKKDISEYTLDCNNLNDHIEELKYLHDYAGTQDYGSASLRDQSQYNFKRSNWGSSQNNRFTHNCGASVVKRAQERPFDYFCKYFNVKANEQNLENYESIFNDFAAAENGTGLLARKKAEIIDSISGDIPFVIRSLDSTRLERQLGFKPIRLSNVHFPVYTFQYVSSGGNSSMSCEIQMDTDNLERFVGYLGEKVKFKKSVAGQRALMTQALRSFIKERDDYTCQSCGANVYDESNLLLEIDHIMPLSRGGLTTEDNLQTLCWRCNRSKGSKVLDS